MTYSILGRDPANGDLGVAVQSKFPGVRSLVPYGEADVGVVATQAFGNPRHGTVGLRLLSCGPTPQQAVDLTAFMLEMNGFETGSAQLEADQGTLDAISLGRIRSE